MTNNVAERFVNYSYIETLRAVLENREKAGSLDGLIEKDKRLKETNANERLSADLFKEKTEDSQPLTTNPLEAEEQRRAEEAEKVTTAITLTEQQKQEAETAKHEPESLSSQPEQKRTESTLRPVAKKSDGRRVLKFGSSFWVGVSTILIVILALETLAVLNLIQDKKSKELIGFLIDHKEGLILGILGIILGLAAILIISQIKKGEAISTEILKGRSIPLKAGQALGVKIEHDEGGKRYFLALELRPGRDTDNPNDLGITVINLYSQKIESSGELVGEVERPEFEGYFYGGCSGEKLIHWQPIDEKNINFCDTTGVLGNLVIPAANGQILLKIDIEFTDGTKLFIESKKIESVYNQNFVLTSQKSTSLDVDNFPPTSS